MHPFNRNTRLFLALLACLLVLGGCSRREDIAARPDASAAPAATEAPSYTVTYYLGEETLRTESVRQGDCPAPYDEPEVGARLFLGWENERGEIVTPYALPVSGDVSYRAVLAPGLRQDTAYLTAEGGLARPDDALSRQELAVALYTLLAETPDLPAVGAKEPLYDREKLPDQALVLIGESITPAPGAYVQAVETEPPAVEPYAEYQILVGMCEAGYLAGADESGSFRPHAAVSAGELRELLGRFFRANAVAEAMAALESESVSRYDFACLLNGLLGRESAAEGMRFADLASDDVRAAQMRVACLAQEAPASGMLLLQNGQLYCIGEDGMCLKDADVGTLHFGPDGRYTSGDEALDALVVPMIAGVVDVRAAREEQLRAVYDYVRDHFVYLRRNYYDMGEHGWEIEEATYFLGKHYGNCYSFAAGLWALARGLGYDAHAISGFQGENTSPHGWVDIVMEDGVRYFYDVEAEYAALRDGAQLFPMFKLPWSSATVVWNYKFDWVVEGFPIT